MYVLVPMPSLFPPAPDHTSSRPPPACPGPRRDSLDCTLSSPCHPLQSTFYLSYLNICLHAGEAVSALPTTTSSRFQEHATRQTLKPVLQVHRPTSGSKRE